MILIDNESVVTDPGTFKNALGHYDMSLPTGTTHGRRWFRTLHYQSKKAHYMGEYVCPDPKAEYADIKWRVVYLVDDETAAAYYRTMGTLRDNVHKMLDPFWDGLERSCSREDVVRANTYHNELRRPYDPKALEQKTPYYPKS